MSNLSFDDLTDVYESLMDWPKRLAVEGPFLRQLFEQAHVKRVADVACGTGQHAALFHSWGLDVLGTDVSPKMVQRARELFGEPSGLRWRVHDYQHSVADPGSLDAIVCLGNSLALAPDAESAVAALGEMLETVRPGGLVIVHVLNLWKIPPGPCLWQKVLRRTLGGKEVLILKAVHRCAEAGRVELIVVPQQEEAEFRAHSVSFLGLKPDQLQDVAHSHDAEATFYGNAKAQPYDPETSADLIMVAKKRGG